MIPNSPDLTLVLAATQEPVTLSWRGFRSDDLALKGLLSGVFERNDHPNCANEEMLRHVFRETRLTLEFYDPQN